MRIMVMFDLPTETSKNLRDYRKFKKFLVDNGFIMEQYSIYTKLAINRTAAENYAKRIHSNKPPSGLVQLLKVTEKQYSEMEFLVGEKDTDVIFSTERITII